MVVGCWVLVVVVVGGGVFVVGGVGGVVGVGGGVVGGGVGVGVGVGGGGGGFGGDIPCVTQAVAFIPFVCGDTSTYLDIALQATDNFSDIRDVVFENCPSYPTTVRFVDTAKF